MTVYEYVKENEHILKTLFKAGFVSSKFTYHIEIIDYYFMRLERGRAGANATRDTIDKFNINKSTFYRIYNNLLSEI